MFLLIPNNISPLVLNYHPFNFKVRDVIKKNFHILKNDPQISSVFSNVPLFSFEHSKNICETLVHSSLPQDSSSPIITFPCGVPRCQTCVFIDSSTTILAQKSKFDIKHHFTCASSHISFTASHALNVTCFILEKLEDVWGQGLVSIAMLSKAAMLIGLLPDISILAITVFQIWKFKPSV